LTKDLKPFSFERKLNTLLYTSPPDSPSLPPPPFPLYTPQRLIRDRSPNDPVLSVDTIACILEFPAPIKVRNVKYVHILRLLFELVHEDPDLADVLVLELQVRVVLLDELVESVEEEVGLVTVAYEVLAETLLKGTPNAEVEREKTDVEI
jgi:hypothetical protein